jgi:hypothetical protein
VVLQIVTTVVLMVTAGLFGYLGNIKAGLVFIFYQLEVASVLNMGNCNTHKTLFTLQVNDVKFLSSGLGERLMKVVRHRKLGIYADKVQIDKRWSLLPNFYVGYTYREIIQKFETSFSSNTCLKNSNSVCLRIEDCE